MATLVEKTITTHRRCPKNHMVVKKFQIKNGTVVLYYFYCEACRKKYEESQLTMNTSKKKEQKSSTKGIVLVSSKNANQNEANIIRTNENGPLKINLWQSGSLPKKCPCCDVSMQKLTYEVKEIGKKRKKLVGKECPECHRIYYGKAIYSVHSQNFVLDEEDLKSESHVKIDEKDKHSAVSIKSEPIEKDEQEIRINYQDRLTSVELVPVGVKLPKSCYRCHLGLRGSTIQLHEKNVDIKVCARCKVIHIHSKYYDIFGDLFINGKEENDIVLPSDNNETDNAVTVIQEDEQAVIEEVKHIDDEIENNVEEESYTDDFGNEFDFSELNHLLDL